MDRSPDAIPTILLLDENSKRFHAIQEALTRRGARVPGSGDAAQALDAALQEPIDVALVMPCCLVERPSLIAELVATVPRMSLVVLPPPTADASAALLDGTLAAYVDAALALARAANLIGREAERLGSTASEEQQPSDGESDEMRRLVLNGTRAMLATMERRTHIGAGEGDRVADIAVALAEEIGGFDPDKVRTAAQVHDLGRLGVSPAIWRKPGPLSDQERQDMQRHTMVGLQMLRPLLDDPQILAGVLWHHERWDGQGYPDRLRGDEIPPLARVIAVADALEALVRTRPHRPARDWNAAVEEVVLGRGTQFAPEVVDALLAIQDRLGEMAGAHLVGAQAPPH
jgi:HD-GYP domain-containing protein (c-di-GMP phosphodiesterase class II)